MAKNTFPVRELLVVPHRDGNLTVRYPVLGEDKYETNFAEMANEYSNPETGEIITFRPSTTSESISVANYGFGENGKFDAKRDIFGSRWLRLGPIVRTPEGVFVNPPKREWQPLPDEYFLNECLKNTEKINGIWLYTGNNPLSRDFAFAPYESFERGVQDCHTFVRGGLARALEYTSEKVAPKLTEMASPKHYKKGVNVSLFEDVKGPVPTVVSLYPGKQLDSDMLRVMGYYWTDTKNGGYALWALNESRCDAPKNLESDRK